MARNYSFNYKNTLVEQDIRDFFQGEDLDLTVHYNDGTSGNNVYFTVGDHANTTPLYQSSEGTTQVIRVPAADLGFMQPKKTYYYNIWTGEPDEHIVLHHGKIIMNPGIIPLFNIVENPGETFRLMFNGDFLVFNSDNLIFTPA